MNEKSPETIQMIEHLLEVPGKYGAWWTARRLLQDIYKFKKEVIRDASFDLRDLPFTAAARPLLWRRDLEPHMVGWWVHLFDKTSQHLSACRGVNTGIGDPVHITDSALPIYAGFPGIYRVEWVLPFASDFDGETFPPIVEMTQEWVTNDVLVFAIDRGYQFRITEAWVFRDYTKVLDKWAERIWHGLQATKGVYPEVYAELKAISHVGPGAFATGQEKHEKLDLIHPNWWADVVGKARVNMLCNLEKFGAPVCIRTDGLYYITRDSNPRTAVPGILERMGQSGGYKIPDGWKSFQLTPEIYNQAIGLGHSGLSSLFRQHGGLKDGE